MVCLMGIQQVSSCVWMKCLFLRRNIFLSLLEVSESRALWRRAKIYLIKFLLKIISRRWWIIPWTYFHTAHKYCSWSIIKMEIESIRISIKTFLQIKRINKLPLPGCCCGKSFVENCILFANRKTSNISVNTTSCAFGECTASTHENFQHIYEWVYGDNCHMQSTQSYDSSQWTREKHLWKILIH